LFGFFLPDRHPDSQTDSQADNAVSHVANAIIADFGCFSIP
jgi:hypothetical protein